MIDRSTRAPFFLLCTLLALSCKSSPTAPSSPTTATTSVVTGVSTSTGAADPLTIYACDDPALGLDEAGEALVSVGFGRCAMPFGILISADDDFSKPHLTMTATILAELLDLDRDGAPDDSDVATELADWRRTAWLAMPSDDRRWEEEQLPVLQEHLGYDIIIPSWWTGSSSGRPDTRTQQVMVEEVTHFITQFGWSTVYPDELGVNGWSSIIARETERAQCEWWQHPENDCPDNPAPSPGDCSYPSCDVVEFYQQVLVMRAGMEPGWLGIGFPRDREALEALLSDEIKAMMDDPAFHQPSEPLQFSYP